MILRAAALIRTMSTSAASKIQGGVKNASGVKKVPTGEGVNARDVASAASGVLRRGLFFRSSQLFNLPQIKTVVDLRGDKDVPVSVPASAERVALNFITPGCGIRILGSLGFRTTISALFSSHGKRDLAEATVRDIGMAGLYKMIILHCGDEVKKALALMANPGNFPLVVHCIHGKDRTGIVVALVLLLCDVPVSEVLDDYAKSAPNLIEAKAEYIPESSMMYLPDELILSRREDLQTGMLDVITAMMTHPGTAHDAARQYVLGVGVTRQQIDSIRKNLLA